MSGVGAESLQQTAGDEEPQDTDSCFPVVVLAAFKVVHTELYNPDRRPKDRALMSCRRLCCTFAHSLVLVRSVCPVEVHALRCKYKSTLLVSVSVSLSTGHCLFLMQENVENGFISSILMHMWLKLLDVELKKKISYAEWFA